MLMKGCASGVLYRLEKEVNRVRRFNELYGTMPGVLRSARILGVIDGICTGNVRSPGAKSGK